MLIHVFDTNVAEFMQVLWALVTQVTSSGI